MGAHRHGKVAVGAPFLRSRSDGRCLWRVVGMRRSTTVSGWRWPCASSNHISAPPNTLTKAMRVADDLVLVRLHFFGKDRFSLVTRARQGHPTRARMDFKSYTACMLGLLFFNLCSQI